MSIKAVIVFLLVICALGMIAGPGFRRFVRVILGIGPRTGANRRAAHRKGPRR